MPRTTWLGNGRRSHWSYASIILARLWAEQGRRVDARNLLGPIHQWFGEGFCNRASERSARATRGNKVAHVEIAFTPGDDSNEGSAAPRVDIAVLIADARNAPISRSGKRYVQTTPSRADEDEGRRRAACPGRDQNRQIRKVYRRLQECSRACRPHIDVCRLLAEFHKQTWHRMLDPVMEDIAAGDGGTRCCRQPGGPRRPYSTKIEGLDAPPQGPRDERKAMTDPGPQRLGSLTHG
jgi:hypothetical protein